jgi:hypothetical protein
MAVPFQGRPADCADAKSKRHDTGNGESIRPASKRSSDRTGTETLSPHRAGLSPGPWEVTLEASEPTFEASEVTFEASEVTFEASELTLEASEASLEASEATFEASEVVVS